ncbi:MAG: hypothetical protein JXA20_01100 [Spirochaetes bacterium]|nr:hypothetical protein [Spirochaetota bacterium]
MNAGCGGSGGASFPFFSDGGIQIVGPEEEAAVELINNRAADAKGENQDTSWYYFNGAVDSSYDLTWSKGVTVSACNAQDEEDCHFTGNKSGAAKIRTKQAGRVYLKITPDEGVEDYQIKYTMEKAAAPATWTFLFYINGGGNLDVWNMEELKQMLSGYHENMRCNVILLLDKEANWPLEPFTEEFNDTRLYIIVNNGTTAKAGDPGGRLERIHEGGTEFPDISSAAPFEANMGDAVTLKKFIEFGKANFPARRYALLVSGHGSGPFGVSPDYEPESDLLHPGEMSAVLDSTHHVDLLAFRACLMGNIDVAYQFRNITASVPKDPRFYADIMLGSPNTERNEGPFSFGTVFQRISSNPGFSNEIDDLNPAAGAHEAVYDPATLDARTLGNCIVEERRDYMRDTFGQHSAVFQGDGLICYDLSKVQTLQHALNDFASQLHVHGEKKAIETLRDNVFKVRNYFLTFKTHVCPLYELGDLCRGVRKDEGNSFSADTRAAAETVLVAIDGMTLYSYASEDGYYAAPHTPGISVFFADNNSPFNPKSEPSWAHYLENQWWYTPAIIPEETRNLHPEKFFGNLDFCRDGATVGNGVVENWFELLDAWYWDGDPDGAGPKTDFNDYRY